MGTMRHFDAPQKITFMNNLKWHVTERGRGLMIILYQQKSNESCVDTQECMYSLACNLTLSFPLIALYRAGTDKGEHVS